jgi:hypothetical protein
MTEHARFVPLATYPNALAADIARQTLEAAGIPVLVKGLQVGVFGPSFMGDLYGGVELHVPSPELERARLLLEE